MKKRRIISFEEFKDTLESSKELQNQFREDPISAVNQFQQNPLTTDKWIYRLIVLALGISIISIVIGVILLLSSGKISDDNSIPTILTAIGSGSIGALAGLLAPPPKIE